MKGAQTRQDTATDPAGELPLIDIARRRQPHPGSGEHGLELVVQPLREAVDQRRAADDDDVAEQMRADVHVDLAEAAFDEFGDRLSRRRGRVRRVGEGHFRVEEAFDGAVAFGAEGLVVAVGHFKGPGGRVLRRFEVVAALSVVACQTAAGPDLDDGLFELGEDAFFLESAEGRVRGRSIGVGAEGGLSRGEGFDGGFGGDEVVWVERDLRARGGEEETELGGNVVSCEWRTNDPLLEDEAIVHWGYGGVGGADIDHEGGSFAYGEAARR